MWTHRGIPLLRKFFFLFLIYISAVRSQPSDLQFDHITMSDGLSQDIVTILYRDRLGFIWIGTEDGLNRYDGYSIESYKNRPRDSTSLPGNNITGICDFGDEDLLVTYSRGLCIYSRARNLFIPPRGKLRSYAAKGASKPVTDRKGRCWIISESKKILRCDPDNDVVEIFDLFPDSSSGDILKELKIDSNDSLWVTAEHSLAVFEEGENRFHLYKTPHEHSDVINWSSARDKSGNFWIATNAGLYRFDRKHLASGFIPLNFSMGGSSHKGDQLVGGLCWDRKDRLWLGGFNGLYCFNPKTGTTHRYAHAPDDPMSLESNRIYQLMLDPSNVLWVGTWRGGLSKADLKKDRFGHYHHSETTPFVRGANDIIGIIEQPRSTVWCASASGGLTQIQLNSGTYRQFSNAVGNTLNFVTGDITSLAGDTAGNVWVAVGNKLSELNIHSERFTTIAPPPIQVDYLQIQHVYHDRHGYLWMGVQDFGIVRYRPSAKVFTYFKRERNEPGAPAITGAWMFFEDRRGNLWAGGWGGNSSLYAYDREKDEFNGIPKNELLSARSAAEDDAGNLWIGTWGLGMSRYNPQTGEVKQFLDEDGLPSNYVKGILNDDRGNLWISTENGLSRFSIARQEFRNYSVSDGLQANFFYTGSCLKGSDGRLYFGGPNGFNAFYPDSIREESYSVPVVFTEFRVFDRPQTFDRDVALIEEIRLPHSEDMFSFEYASLDYSTPKRNQYAYRLEGYDKDWIQAGNRRYASYTHLDPDEYLFTVKGTNSDGVWSSQTASIRLIIAPAFWQTWWFRIGVVLLLGASLYAVYRFRLRRLLDIERTRSFIATDLHDDIGASLTSIALSSDLARREVSAASPMAAKRLEKIAETSRSLLDSMNDIVWSIKPENDALEQTILRMEDYAVEMLEENGIDLHVQIPEELKKMKLPMDVRRNLFLIFKEAIGNVLKHAGANHVDVRIAWNTAGRRASDLLLSITDNGTGFDPASQKQGNGLGNMSRRAGHLRGNVTIVSAPGRGTNVEIRFPIKSPI